MIPSRDPAIETKANWKRYNLDLLKDFFEDEASPLEFAQQLNQARFVIIEALCLMHDQKLHIDPIDGIQNSLYFMELFVKLLFKVEEGGQS